MVVGAVKMTAPVAVLPLVSLIRLSKTNSLSKSKAARFTQWNSALE